MSRDGSLETWSKEISDPSALDPRTASILESTYDQFPACIWTPAIRGSFGKYPPTFLCRGANTFTILRDEAPESTPMILSCSRIDAIESGRALLHAWIAFHFDGRREAVFFNAVSEPLYIPFLNQYRSIRELPFTPSDAVDSYLGEMLYRDYKYFTFPKAVLESRLPEAAFYHPTEHLSRSFFARRIIPSYFLLAAAGMLYVFSEEKLLRSPRTADYSMVTRFIAVENNLLFSEKRRYPLYSSFVLEKADVPLFLLPLTHLHSDNFDAFCADAGIVVRKLPVEGFNEG